MSIKVSFPDGKTDEFANGITAKNAAEKHGVPLSVIKKAART